MKQKLKKHRKKVVVIAIVLVIVIAAVVMLEMSKVDRQRKGNRKSRRRILFRWRRWI